jgi:hypothetical protein
MYQSTDKPANQSTKKNHTFAALKFLAECNYHQFWNGLVNLKH